MNNHAELQGFVSIAQNSSVDYLTLAYVQALNIKSVMPSSKYAIIVDTHTKSLVTDKHQQVFDYVIEITRDYAYNHDWKLANEWQVYGLTPFKETIKLEADLLIPRSIEHWWDTFRLRDVVLSTGCRNYLGSQVVDSNYRTIFRNNNLPDVYNGLMYFRYSETAHKFFKAARDIFLNWDHVVKELVKVTDQTPTTDVVYAIASKVVGVELTTLPSAEFINFTHMKPGINGWPEGSEFHKLLNVIVEPPAIRVNNIQQQHPFHYHYKDFITEEIITHYEQLFSTRRSVQLS
jgi:hypothetical protein